MCLDIKDHFLATPIDSNKYMRVKSKYILVYIKTQYNIISMIN